MPTLQRIKKPTHKGKKILLDRGPKLIENDKQTLLLQGRKSSDTLKTFTKDIMRLKKPHCQQLSRKHDIVPFENAVPLELLAKKYGCSLFLFTSKSKKRPNNIVIGQTYDKTVLDLFELDLVEFKSLLEFKNDKISLGTKPCLIFNGPEWEQNNELQRLRTLFVDLFQGELVENIRLQGLEHALSFTYTPNAKILIRSYRILFKKSATLIPRVELDEIGPSIDLQMKRVKLASEQLYKTACRKPRALKPTFKKNISTNKLGTKLGRVHVGRQNVNRLQTRKMKGLRGAKKGLKLKSK